jgi:putative hemolysin
MAKDKKPRKITPEEQARFEEFTREINARIAERRAREREQDAPGPSGR